MKKTISKKHKKTGEPIGSPVFLVKNFSYFTAVVCLSRGSYGAAKYLAIAC